LLVAESLEQPATRVLHLLDRNLSFVELIGSPRF
jgi:hypothetical protein